MFKSEFKCSFFILLRESNGESYGSAKIFENLSQNYFSPPEKKKCVEMF